MRKLLFFASRAILYIRKLIGSRERAIRSLVHTPKADHRRAPEYRSNDDHEKILSDHGGRAGGRGYRINGLRRSVLDRSEILSSDQNVIPDEALSFDPLLASEIIPGGTNTVRGGSLVVDLKKIAPGTATIYLYLDYNNSGSAALMRTFTVTEYGEIEIDTLDVPFVVKNNTSYDDEENITISFTDSDPVYGSNAPERQSFKLSELTSGEGTFGYAVGHTYSISASRAVLSDDGIHYDPDSMVSFSVSDWVGPGSSVTGFVKIEDGELTLPNVPATPVQITMND